MRFKTYRRILAGAVLTMVATLALPLASLAAKPAPAPKPPSASTGGALALTYSSGTLTATVNPHGVETTYYFQYGPTTAYGAQTPTASVGSGTDGVHLEQVISGLQVGNEYHYRVVAVSSAGTTTGQDRVFNTRSVPLRFELPTTPRLAVFGIPLAISGSLTGTGGADREVALQASQFPFLGSFENIGSPQLTNAAGSFTFKVNGLSQNTHLRVMVLGTRPIYSPVVNVRVALRVTLHARVTNRPGYVHLYGTVTPAATGAPVALQLQRLGRGPLTMGGAVVRRSANGVGRFSAIVFIRHGLGGDYRAFVKASDDRYAPSNSREVLVHSAPASVRQGAH